MKSKTPKEDPQAKADRERERRLSELDRTASMQQEAAGLTSDLRDVYGLKKLRQPGAVAFNPVKSNPAKSVSAAAAQASGPGARSPITGKNVSLTQAMLLPSFARPLRFQNGQNR